MKLSTIPNIDNAPYSYKHGSYGGASGLKDGVIIDGDCWIVKYPKNAEYLKNHAEMTYTNDPLSEYLGSHIYQILGYPVHETMLVQRKHKIAVACKDFVQDKLGEQLLEIRTIKNAANEQLSALLEESFSSTGDRHISNFDEILLHLKYNDILTSIPGMTERFWDMMVIDIFINNSDRNNGNWGIIRSPYKQDRLAPIFDNGGSFNGKTPDSRLQRLLSDKQLITNSVINNYTSFGHADSSYGILAKQMLDYDIPELRDAIIKNVPLIVEKQKEIIALIDNLPEEVCSPIRKAFYISSLQLRLEHLLLPAYEKQQQIMQQKNID